MAATLGRDGGVVINGSLMSFIDSWGLEFEMETVDVTSFGDTSRVRVQTFRDWSATAGGTLSRANAQQAALLGQFEGGTITPVQLRLRTGATSYWQGSAVLSGASIDSEVGDKVSVTFTFESAGPITFTV